MEVDQWMKTIERCCSEELEHVARHIYWFYLRSDVEALIVIILYNDKG